MSDARRKPPGKDGPLGWTWKVSRRQVTPALRPEQRGGGGDSLRMGSPVSRDLRREPRGSNGGRDHTTAWRV